MNKILSLLLVFLLMGFLSYLYWEKHQVKHTILLTGASFATADNGWFELGVRELKAKGINKAVPSESIADTANKLANGELYTTEELDEMDAFVIMQVHDRDVASLDSIKENYEDYILPFDRWESDAAAAFDYSIKRYYADCYNLKFNEKSKYFDTSHGKPVIIVLATHWHDSRTLLNSSVRVLAERWGFPVIEFDKNIGFSRSTIHPITKEQVSKQHTDWNFETIDGVEYGWHPAKGRQAYIQQRMAAVFADQMRSILPIKK